MAQRKTPERDFEATMKRLEEIVSRLEQGDVPLEKSLELYEEGIALSKTCAEILTRAELTLKRLGRDLEGNLKAFDKETDTEE